MAELSFDASDPSTCLLLDLESGIVWQGTNNPGEWTLFGEMAPGVIHAFTSNLREQPPKDTVWI